MKFKWFIWLSIAVMIVLSFMSNAAQACPNCFASTTKKVLHTYYLSAVFLSLLPFGVVAFISTWLLRHKRNSSHNNSTTRNPQNQRLPASLE